MAPTQPKPKTILRECEPGSWEKCDTHYLEFTRQDVHLEKAIAFHLACGSPEDQVIKMSNFIFIW